MKRLKSKRLLAAASVVVAAGVVPLVTATPASANQSSCVNYLGNLGIYRIGPKVKSACKLGEHLSGRPLCTNNLVVIHVRPEHAIEACMRAGN
ncbi:hypothetical protein ACWGI9_18430 [Streptomyces sp. NPDC054833]